MHCQDCGNEAPTVDVTYYQTIGMVIMWRLKSIKGRMCRSCGLRHFVRMTGLTLLTGWWGIISFWINCFSILNNLVRACYVLSLPAAPASTPGVQARPAHIEPPPFAPVAAPVPAPAPARAPALAPVAQYVLCTVMGEIPLYSGLQLSTSDLGLPSTPHTASFIAEVVAKPAPPGSSASEALGLRNLGSTGWTASVPGGAPRPIGPGQVVPLRDGLAVDIGSSAMRVRGG